MVRENKILTNSYLIKQLPQSTAFINTKFEIVHASDRWIEEFDFSTKNIFGKTIFELNDFVSEKWKKELDKCFKGLPTDSTIERETRGKTNEKWYQWTSIPWYDDNENIIGAIINTEDVSEKVLTELRLEKLEIALSNKSEIAKIGSWEYCSLKRITTWDKVARKIHQVPDNFEPTLENSIDFFKEGYSRNTISMLIYEAMQNGTSWSEKLQITTGKGEDKWVISAGKPIYKNGEFVSLIGTVQDINEQVVSNIKTKESEQLLKTLIDHIPVHVFIKDTESRKILVNKAEYEFLGASSAEEVIGQSDYDHYPKDSAELNRIDDLMVLNTLQPILGKELRDPKRTGEDTTFLTSKIPLIGEDGNAYGLVGLSLDITNIKRKEVELRELINVTSLQNKKLLNFAHIVSHNLRSHTANFSMLLDFLSNEKDEQEKIRITEMLTTASDNLLETLDNLNEVVTISANSKIKKESVNFNTTLKGIQENLKNTLEENNVTIINKIDSKTTVNVIPAYIDNILINFITNAIKYHFPDRDPEITFSSQSKQGYTIISIKDNGVGLDLKKYGDKLFGMYKTFHNHKDSKGIGLYVVKNQVEAMNGRITVDSELGKGSTFNIFFNEKN